MTKRLTALADASVGEADMTIRMDKTFTHHVQDQEKKKATEAEALAAQKKFKHQCDFCPRRFKTQAAMYIHRVSCPYNYVTTEEAYPVDDIVGVFGRVDARWYLVKYEGYPEPEWGRGH